MIKVEWKGVKELQKALDKFAKQAVPHAMRNGCNRSAFEARDVWGKRVESEMTLRNTFTARSLRVQKARGTNTETMQATLGSTAPYMGKLEVGGPESARSGKGLPIPTPVASGQAPGAKRTKLVRASNKMTAITLAKRPGATRPQRNAIAIQRALKGSHFAFIETTQGRRLITKVTGNRQRIKVQTIWDLSRHTVQVRPVPTLKQTLDAIGPRLPGIFADALREQCKRHGMPGF